MLTTDRSFDMKINPLNITDRSKMFGFIILLSTFLTWFCQILEDSGDMRILQFFQENVVSVTLNHLFTLDIP